MKKNIELSPNIEALFGTRDENLHVLEDGLNINIDLRSDRIELEGAPRDVARAEQLFADYEHLRKSGHQFVNGDLSSMLRVFNEQKTEVAFSPFYSPARSRYAELKWLVTAPLPGCAIRFVPLSHPAICVQKTSAGVCPNSARLIPEQPISIIHI